MGQSRLLDAIHDLGVADTLVATLNHESPYCVAAAVITLCWIGQSQGGQRLVDACGAIPALVQVVERRCPPRDLEQETGLFRRYVQHAFLHTSHASGWKEVHHLSCYECVTVYSLGVRDFLLASSVLLAPSLETRFSS
jgi:hypothetical protein